MPPFSSSLNIPLWCKELQCDPDKDFLLDGIRTGFKLLPQDSLLQPAEIHNCHFTMNAEAGSKVENIIKVEIWKTTTLRCPINLQ